MYERTQPILLAHEPTLMTSVRQKLGESNYRYVLNGLLRNVFLIELVNDNISSTKMEVRWTVKESGGKKQEKFDQSDARFSTFEDCLKILLKLLKELQAAIEDYQIARLLKLYQRYNMLPYEIPLDYLHSPITDNSLSHIHCPKNVQWIFGEKYRKTLKLREILLSPDKNTKPRLFSSILKDKIKVKTYLTDRVQTGEHKTDRDKRWEVHPESVHFAFRRDCIENEYRLIDQLYHFEGFPSDVFSLLKEEGIMVDEQVFRCPVTQNPFSFVEFEKEIESRVHGKSNFQVGHLNPLKLSSVGLASGHTPQNISWLSANGNRIQGDLSLKQIRELLEQIHRNYVDQEIITQQNAAK